MKRFKKLRLQLWEFKERRFGKAFRSCRNDMKMWHTILISNTGKVKSFYSNSFLKIYLIGKVCSRWDHYPGGVTIFKNIRPHEYCVRSWGVNGTFDTRGNYHKGCVWSNKEKKYVLYYGDGSYGS